MVSNMRGILLLAGTAICHGHPILVQVAAVEHANSSVVPDNSMFEGEPHVGASQGRLSAVGQLTKSSVDESLADGILPVTSDELGVQALVEYHLAGSNGHPSVIRRDDGNDMILGVGQIIITVIFGSAALVVTLVTTAYILRFTSEEFHNRLHERFGFLPRIFLGVLPRTPDSTQAVQPEERSGSQEPNDGQQLSHVHEVNEQASDIGGSTGEDDSQSHDVTNFSAVTEGVAQSALNAGYEMESIVSSSNDTMNAVAVPMLEMGNHGTAYRDIHSEQYVDTTADGGVVGAEGVGVEVVEIHGVVDGEGVIGINEKNETNAD